MPGDVKANDVIYNSVMYRVAKQDKQGNLSFGEDKYSKRQHSDVQKALEEIAKNPANAQLMADLQDYVNEADHPSASKSGRLTVTVQEKYTKDFYEEAVDKDVPYEGYDTQGTRSRVEQSDHGDYKHNVVYLNRDDIDKHTREGTLKEWLKEALETVVDNHLNNKLEALKEKSNGKINFGASFTATDEPTPSINDGGIEGELRPNNISLDAFVRLNDTMLTGLDTSHIGNGNKGFDARDKSAEITVS